MIAESRERMLHGRRLRFGLPASVDAERFVLGAILLDDRRYLAAAALSPGDFSLKRHNQIWRCMRDLHARGERIDRVTVSHELQRHGQLDVTGGLTYLVSLDEGLPHIPNIESYIRILSDKAARRRIIGACEQLMGRVALDSEDLEEILAAGQELFAYGAGIAQPYSSIDDLPTIAECGAPNIAYLIDPVLPCGSLVALTGDSGSGKSTLATAWARDVWRFRGVRTLMLDRENPLPVIADRLARLGIEDGAGLKFWGGWLRQEAPLPDSQIVMEWVRGCEPRPLVVVDSFSAYCDGDQNDAAIVRSVMHRCRRLADLGGTVIVIHHDGKAETAKDYRGSSDFKAAIDQGYHVSNSGAEGQLDKLVLRPFKARIGPGEEITYYYAGGSFVHREEAEAHQTLEDQLTAILCENPGINARKFDELVNAKGLNRRRSRTFIDDGVHSGAIRQETGPGRTKRYYLEAPHAE